MQQWIPEGGCVPNCVLLGIVSIPATIQPGVCSPPLSLHSCPLPVTFCLTDKSQPTSCEVTAPGSFDWHCSDNQRHWGPSHGPLVMHASCVFVYCSFGSFVSSLLSFLTFTYSCADVCAHICNRTHVEVRGQLAEVDSLFPPCGCLGSNSGRQAYWHAPLPMEPSHPLLCLFLVRLVCVWLCICCLSFATELWASGVFSILTVYRPCGFSVFSPFHVPSSCSADWVLGGRC